MTRTTWRGVTVDERTAHMLDHVAAHTPDDLVVTPTQGCYTTATSASSGTHAGGGVVDLRTRNLTADRRALLLRVMRQTGFAGWLRTASQGFSGDHLHAVAVQPGGMRDVGILSGAAHAQVVDYYEGRNGLANRGRDDGPRQWVGVTWESLNRRGSCPGTIVPEARGSWVRAWQAEMIRTGWMADIPANRDGWYGPGMLRRAREMQAHLHVAVDGILGPVTWAALA
jgi:peptidoglycan hydrolase-like protein with peptidoglycan-binding domain